MNNQGSLATLAHRPKMSYPYDNSQYNYAPGAANPYAQQGQQSYDQNPPSIRNPFPAPPPAHNAYGAHNAGYDPEQEALMAQWQSQYAPVDAQASKDARGKAENPNTTQVGVRPSVANPSDGKTSNPDKKVTVIRKGGGQTWEDNSLLEWDPTQFRIMVGNLAGEVTDDSLAKAFAPTVSPRRVLFATSVRQNPRASVSCLSRTVSRASRLLAKWSESTSAATPSQFSAPRRT